MMALGESLAAGVAEQGGVVKSWRGQAEGLVDQQLAGG